MTAAMTPARYIRERVFGIKTQAAFAELLGYEQATISRFETGLRLSAEAQERIRALARARGIAWDNNWFWSVPDDSGGAPRSRPRLATRAVA